MKQLREISDHRVCQTESSFMTENSYCYGFQLTKADSSNICESCVVQLRGALQFKEQVLHAEQQLLGSLQDPALQGI